MSRIAFSICGEPFYSCLFRASFFSLRVVTSWLNYKSRSISFLTALSSSFLMKLYSGVSFFSSLSSRFSSPFSMFLSLANYCCSYLNCCTYFSVSLLMVVLYLLMNSLILATWLFVRCTMLRFMLNGPSTRVEEGISYRRRALPIMLSYLSTMIFYI